MSTVMGTTGKNNVIDVEVYAKGEPGVGIESALFEYQAGNSSTTVPTGTWSTEFITPEEGQYLWTRTTYTYTNGTTAVSYNISYFSIGCKFYEFWWKIWYFFCFFSISHCVVSSFPPINYYWICYFC